MDGDKCIGGDQCMYFLTTQRVRSSKHAVLFAFVVGVPRHYIDQMNKLLRNIKTSDRQGYLVTMISSKLYEHCNSVITFCN